MKLVLQKPVDKKMLQERARTQDTATTQANRKEIATQKPVQEKLLQGLMKKDRGLEKMVGGCEKKAGG